MKSQLKRLRDDNKPTCGTPLSAMLRPRLAATFRLARREPHNFPRFLQFVSSSVAIVWLDSRTMLTGRRS
ncbi:hypothetical protein [Paraburkholderia sp. BR14374]|uniref:hypothetical protein n=1 Tax=Paraburkholderia sp. BR14374 TaxID=3237007 RepID=UPI0034CF4819